MYRSIADFVERQFGESGQRVTVEGRHRDHYLTLFEPMMHYDKGMMFADRFSVSLSARLAWADEQENVLAVYERYRTQEPETAAKAALVWDWLASLFSTPAKRELVLLDASARSADFPPRLRTDLHIAMGQLQIVQGRFEAGHATLIEALEWADGDVRAAVDLNRALGWERLHAPYTSSNSSIKEAEQYFMTALSLAQSEEHLGDQSSIAHALGRCCMLLAQPDKCEEAFKQSLESALFVGSPRLITLAEYSLGMFYLQIEKPKDAMRHYQRLQERTRQMGGENWREISVFMASVLVSEGRFPEATSMLEGLIPDAHRVLDPGHRVFIGLELALCLQLSGDYDRAVELYDEHMPRALEDGGFFTDALHSGFEAFCRARSGQPAGEVRILNHGSMASELLAMQALSSAVKWMENGRGEEGRASLQKAADALESPVHTESQWTHTQLNYYARTAHQMVREVLESTDVDGF